MMGIIMESPRCSLSYPRPALGEIFPMPNQYTQYPRAPRSVPLSAKPIYPNTVVVPLTKGEFALVSSEDFHIVRDRKWQASRHRGYVRAVSYNPSGGGWADPAGEKAGEGEGEK